MCVWLRQMSTISVSVSLCPISRWEDTRSQCQDIQRCHDGTGPPKRRGTFPHPLSLPPSPPFSVFIFLTTLFRERRGRQYGRSCLLESCRPKQLPRSPRGNASGGTSRPLLTMTKEVQRKGVHGIKQRSVSLTFSLPPPNM